MNSIVESVSLLPQGARTFAPFSFELELQFPNAQSSQEAPARPNRALVLATAWSAVWADIARNFGCPWQDKVGSRGRWVGAPPAIPKAALALSHGEPFDLVLLHPGDAEALTYEAAQTATQPSDAAKFWFLPLQAGQTEAQQQLLLLSQLRRSRPDTSFAFEFAAGAREVQRGPEVFCIGLSSATPQLSQ